MRIPASLPVPPDDGRWNRNWAVTIVRTLNKFFESLQGDLEVQSELISLAGRRVGVTNVTTTPYQALSSDDVILMNVGSASGVTLPAGPKIGKRIDIQDSSGAAGANNITVTPSAGTVNGAANYVISTNYGGTRFVYDGTEWIAR